MNVEPLAVDDETRAHVNFLVVSHALTEVDRVNRLVSGRRSETSAEHSWHLVLAAATLAARHAPEVDLADVLVMIAIHDVVEVRAGDVPVYDTAARLAVQAAEADAARELFGLLPAAEAATLLARWEAFEAGRTPEARFARALDRLQPMLLHWAGDGAAWAQRGVTVAQERELAAQVEAWWPSLGPLARAFVEDADARGMLVR